MKTKILFIALLFTSSILAATERQFDFLPTETNTVVYENGRPYLQTSTQNLSVTISYIPSEKNRGWIGIFVKNYSPNSININEKSIQVTSNQLPLKTYSYSELMAEQKRKEGWRKFGAVLADSSQPSSYTQQTGTYQSNTTANAYSNNGYAVYGNATTSGSYQQTTYDATAAAINQAEASRRNAEMMKSIQNRSAQERAEISARALRANTIFPGESLYGEVNFDLPKKSNKSATEIKLIINIGQEFIETTLKEI